MLARTAKLVVVACALAACGGSGPDGPVAATADATPDAGGPAAAEANGGGSTVEGDGGVAPEASTPTGPLKVVAVTFNTGTNDGLDHDDGPADGYGSDQAKLSNDHYGNGLAWKKAVEDTRLFFDALKPDVVVFQELFHSADCANIPAAAKPGFVCDGWKPGDPTVAQVVLGAGYQVACHLGKPDKCAAVKLTFGSFRGCTSALCLDGLAGAPVKDCGGGSRIGRGIIDLASGGELTLVNIHGSSGMKGDDMGCREEQFKQVFENLDGAPAANGKRNLVMGDLNTDPGRLGILDSSARKFDEYVSKSKTFHYVSDVGSNATPTYLTDSIPLFSGVNIDHVVSDALDGSCWAAGVSSGHPPVTTMTYFDHKPIVCTLVEK